MSCTDPSRDNARPRPARGARLPLRVGALLAMLPALGTQVAPAAAQPAEAGSAPESEWRLRGAGSERRGWLLLPSDMGAAGPGQAGLLYHLPTEAPPGTVRRAPGHAVAEPPLALAAFADQITLVFPAPPANNEAEAGSDRNRPVRSVRVAGRDASGTFRFEPVGRLRVLPSLPSDAPLLGFAHAEPGPAALLGSDGATRVQLLVLDDGAWRESPLPPNLRFQRIDMLTLDARLALVTIGDSGSAALWRRTRAEDGSSKWASEPIAAPPPTARLLGVGGQIVTLSQRTNDGQIDVGLLSGETVRPLARVDGVPEAHAGFVVGEDVAIAWVDEEADGRLRLAMVSSVTGRIVYQGFARVAAPVSAEDLRFLALLLGAVMLGVLVFVLRPESLARATHPPPGFAPAEPGRRLVAAAVDLLAGGLASAAIWNAPLGETLNPAYIFLLQGGGAAPVLTTIGVTFLHSVPAEWRTGRTLGKFLTGSRTVRIDGARPALWQAAARTAIKLAAPPLTALLLLDPLRRHPGDVIAATLVVIPAPPPESEEAEGGSGPESADDDRS